MMGRPEQIQSKGSQINFPTRRSILSIIFSLSLGGFVQGYLLLSSSLLTYNEEFHSSFSFKEEQEYDTFSLKFISILLLGEAIGCILFIPFSNLFSRNFTMMVFSLLTLLFVVLNAFAGSIWSLLLCRFFLGVSLSVLLCIGPIYIGEISHRSERGSNFTVFYTMLVLGCIVGATLFLTIHSFAGSGEFLPHTAEIQHQNSNKLAPFDGSTLIGPMSFQLQEGHALKYIQQQKSHHMDGNSNSNNNNNNIDVIQSPSADTGHQSQSTETNPQINSFFSSTIATDHFILQADQIYSVTWRICSLFPIFPLSVLLGALLTIPESPRWLFMNGYHLESERSLAKLRGPIEITDELNEMRNGLSNTYGRLGFCDIFLDSSLLLRCVGSIFINMLQPLVGIQMVYLFTDELTDILGMHSSAMGIALTLAGALIGGLVGYCHFDFWGRRFVMLGGSCFMIVSWVLAAGCVIFGELEKGSAEAFETSRVLSYLFGDFFAIYAFAFALSLGPYSIALPVENFPYNSRTTAICLSTGLQSLLSALFCIFLGLWMQKADHIASQHEDRKDTGEAEVDRTVSFVDIISEIAKTLTTLNPSFEMSGNIDPQSDTTYSSSDSIISNSASSLDFSMPGGLVGFMFFFASASFVLWVFSYFFVVEINGLHLEDIDMFLGNKARLLAYKREMKAKATQQMSRPQNVSYIIDENMMYQPTSSVIPPPSTMYNSSQYFHNHSRYRQYQGETQSSSFNRRGGYGTSSNELDYTQRGGV